MKKSFKRVICVLMSLVLLLCAAVPAFAAEDPAEPFKPVLKQGENIELSITPDKSSYSWNDTVTFTVNIKNIAAQTLAPLRIEIFAETDELFFGDSLDNVFPGEVAPNESKKLDFNFSTRSISTIEKMFVVPFYALKNFFNGLFNDYDEYILTTDVKVGSFKYTFGVKAGYQESPDYYTEDIERIVAMYNEAYKATDPAPTGHSEMKLVGEMTGEGSVGSTLKALSPAANKALQKNSVVTDYIPGNGMLEASDVSAAKAISKNGKTTVLIQLNDQIDGVDAEPGSGSVGRGIGTLGSIDAAFDELGAEITEGKETITLTYTNAYIKCTIDNSNGTIIGGEWHCIVKLLLGDATFMYNGVIASIKNLQATIDYKVVI